MGTFQKKIQAKKKSEGAKLGLKMSNDFPMKIPTMLPLIERNGVGIVFFF